MPTSRFALLLVVIAVFAAPSTRADLFTNVHGQQFTSAFSPMLCNDSGGSSASCDITAVERGPGGPQGQTIEVNAEMSLSATAAFGALTGRALLGATPENPLGGFLVQARASFSDTLTIGGYSGSGYIQYHGSSEGFGGFLPNDFVGFNINSTERGFFSDGGTYTSELYAFTAGVPFSFSISALTGTMGLDESANSFFDVTVDSISVFDSDLNPITGYTLTSASGTFYHAIGEAPEPNAVWMVILVLIGCGRRLRLCR